MRSTTFGLSDKPKYRPVYSDAQACPNRRICYLMIWTFSKYGFMCTEILAAQKNPTIIGMFSKKKHMTHYGKIGLFFKKKYTTHYDTIGLFFLKRSIRHIVIQLGCFKKKHMKEHDTIGKAYDWYKEKISQHAWTVLGGLTPGFLT